MKIAVILFAFVLIVCAAPLLILPACGWLWPIFGFNSGCCPNVAGGPALPPPFNAMTPGTFQWGYPPVGRAELVLPGCAYGQDAFHGSIRLGLMPPFGLTGMDHGGAGGAEPAITDANNTSIEGRAGNSSGLQGWLSTRP